MFALLFWRLCMELMDNPVSEKYIAGSFPNEILEVGNMDLPIPIDFELEAQNYMSKFSDFSDYFNLIFILYKDRKKEIEYLEFQPDDFVMVNTLINTGYFFDQLVIGDNFDEALVNLYPAVTELDRVLWISIVSFYNYEMLLRQDLSRDLRECVFTWIYIFKLVQEKEINSGLTIDVSQLTINDNILQLIKEWREPQHNNLIDKKVFIDISDCDRQIFLDLKKKSGYICKEIEANIRKQKSESLKTEKEWQVFIELLNAISLVEKDTIEKIVCSTSSKEKINAIERYENCLSEIKCGKFKMGDETINILSILDSVEYRFINSPMFCLASTNKSESFLLIPNSMTLVINPKTFNHVFICYHRFRLEQSEINAFNFIEASLSSLKNNLDNGDNMPASLLDMVQAFFDIVDDYIQKNKEIIETVSYTELQNDAVLQQSSLFDFFYALEEYRNDITNRFIDIKNSDFLEKQITKILEGKSTIESKEVIENQIRLESEIYGNFEKKAVVERIAISINIIYLMCDALNIYISSTKNTDLDQIHQLNDLRIKLLRVEDCLTHKLYSNGKIDAVNMLEYREKAGINAVFLSKKERIEEKYRNSIFSEVLKSSIDDLIVGLEKKNIQQLIETKTQIIKEIRRCPNCDDKDYYASWLDSISEKVCQQLILKSEGKSNFQKYRSAIKSKYEKYDLLPSSTLDSLATAEMLFDLYASPEYSQNGFDYSCISSLYYQAFENAYNEMIWRKYSDKLNNLVINGRKFTDVLKSYENCDLTSNDYLGYLDSESKNRRYYLNYGNKVAKVQERCMYKSFSILMKNVVPSSKLNYFCDFFAEVVGFASTDIMLNDSVFLAKCAEFADYVENASGDRNNASHGGIYISLEQCEKDRRTVIKTVLDAEKGDLGLIQQLLDLYL